MSAAVVSLLFWKWTFGDGVACGHGGGRGHGEFRQSVVSITGQKYAKNYGFKLSHWFID